MSHPLTRFLHSAILCLALLLAAPSHAQDITTGLVGHWTLNETSGTTTVDRVGNNDGTMLGGLDASNDATSGVRQGAFNFDGTNDTVQIPHTSDFNLNNFTISFWVNGNKPPQTGSIEQVVAKERNFNFAWIHITASFVQTLHFRSGGTWYRTPILQSLSANTWYHIVGTYDGTDLKVYVNGIEDNSTSASVIPENNTNNVHIGSTTAASSFFDGKIDDVRIYNRALTATDVTSLYEHAPGSIRYNDETEGVEYHDGTNWIHAGLGSYSPNGVTFDGTNDYLTHTPTIEDSKRITGSFWFRRDTTDTSVPAYFHQRNGNTLDIRIRPDSSGGDIIIVAENASNTEILKTTSSTNLNDGNWHHVMFSFDLADAAKSHLYINGASEIATTTYTNDAIRLAGLPHAIGANDSGANKLNGDLADYWFDSGTYLDLSIAANREKFISANNAPMYLGADGSTPLGKAPDIFLSGETSGWHNNKGSSNGFTENGALTDAATQPGNASLDISLSSGLVGQWRLDETSGTTANDSAGSNNGTMQGGMDASSNSAGGQIATALDFDGSNDYIDIPNAVGAAVSGGPLTMSMWMYYRGENSDLDSFHSQHIFALRNGAATTLFLREADHPSNPSQFVALHGTGTIVTQTADNTVPVNSWAHVALTQDGTNVKIYINGVEAASGSAGHSTNINQTNRIGAAGNVGPPIETDFNGLLDDVRLYNRALDINEIQLLYQGGCSSPSKVTGAIIYDDDNKVMSYCNGTEWVAMGPVGGTGGTGCVSPTGAAGDLMYNEDFAVMQYCNGEDWVGIGKQFNTIPTDSLLAHWTLNETAGSTITDSSGNGNNGVWSDGINDDVTEETAAGIVGSAIYFDRTVDNIALGQIYNIASPISVSAWIRPGAHLFGNSYAILSNRTAGTQGFTIKSDEGAGTAPNIQSRLSFTIQGVAKYETTSRPLTQNQWAFITVTYSGSEVSFYINGQFVESMATGSMTTGADMFLGAQGPSAGNSFLGEIDDLRIYTRVLNDGEVASIYNATK